MTTSDTASVAPVSARVSFVPVLVVGALAGFLAGLFGVGGGILIVPALVIVTGMEQRLAHGTSLASVLPIAAASLITYATQGNVDWTVAFWLALGGVVGAIIGTRLLHVLPERLLAMMFIVMLVVSAIRLFTASDATGRGTIDVLTVLAFVGVGLATGVLAGLLGVGGGIVMVPAMILLFGITPAIAKGTSVAVIIPTSLMGTWRNRKKRNADLRAAMIIGVSGIVTAAIGGTISDKMSDTTSNVLFATLLMVVAVRMAWQLYSKRTRTVE